MGYLVFNDHDIQSFDDLSEYGYLVDWTKRSSQKSITVGLLYNGDIAGLVEYERMPDELYNYMYLIEVADDYKGSGIAGKLLAYVGKDALEHGFEGFVLFESKSYLYQYYIEAYKAKPTTGRMLMFDTETTQWLIQEFLDGGEEDGK